MSAALGTAFAPATYGATGVSPSSTVMANLRALDQLVRQAQRIVGAPVVVTSGYRTTDQNADVGGVAGSQHLDGTAADVVFTGIPLATVAQRLNSAIERGELDAGQVIYYPPEVDPSNRGHVHLSLPTRTSRNRQLIHTASAYLPLDPAHWPAFGVAAAVGVGTVLLVLLGIWLLWGRE